MIKKQRGFTLVELLVVIAIIAALGAIGFSMVKSAKGKSQQAAALHKMRDLGIAFATYTTDKNGLLPFEDSTGTDDWQNASRPENQEAWYNALPRLMNSKSVGELGMTNPIGFYDAAYPLFIPGAPYPSGDKRLAAPIFAIGMNSRLQRKSEDGVKKQGQFAQIQVPSKTVIFLERGLPNDKKTFSGQRGFDGSPKANARAFAARHNQQGALIFADGHAEMHKASDLITSSGTIIVPQVTAVWTLNPDEDPN